MNYSLISYYASGWESCKGCVVDEWSSDHGMLFTHDISSAAKEAARLDFEDSEKGIHHSGWEHTLLTDGVPAEEKSASIVENFDELHRTAYDDLLKAKQTAEAQKREREKIEREEERRLAAIRKEERERAKLAELKAKYENVE